MTPVAWPSTLPIRIRPDYHETRDDHLLRTTMESGASKVRRRFSSTRVTRRLTLLFDSPAELAAWDELLDDAAGGARPIRWQNPATNSAETVLLIIPDGGLARRQIAAAGALRFAVEVEMEVL